MATTAQFTAEQALQLLDFSGKMDIALLDAVVNCFYSTVGPQVSREELNLHTVLPLTWCDMGKIPPNTFCSCVGITDFKYNCSSEK